MKLAIIISAICLAFGASVLGAALVRAGNMPEPPLRMLLKWSVDEIPGKAALYYDLDGDGKSDLVYAHDVVSTGFGSACMPPARTDEEIILSTGCADKPLIYILNRAIAGVKAAGERWYFTEAK
jgi:hypothetical protein